MTSEKRQHPTRQMGNLFLLIYFLPGQSEVKEIRNVFVECLVELVHMS